MNEKVSIVVPVYNAEKYIEQTVQSVLAQTYSEWELILAENGSTDQTAEKLKEIESRDERIRVLFLRDNVGAAKARNEGVKEATGRYLAFLDADDLWDSSKLEKEVRFMKEKGAAFVFTGYEFGDEDAKPTGKVVRVPETLTYKQALKNTTIFTSTVLFDTEVIPKEKLKMPQIKSEDTALWWKILREGNTAYGLNENLVIYRRPSQQSRSTSQDLVFVSKMGKTECF